MWSNIFPPTTTPLFHTAKWRAKRHNAAHHAPAGPVAFDDKVRVAGRVHALVRLRDIFSPPRVTRRAGDNLQPAPCPRHRPAPRSSHPSWLAARRADPAAASRRRAFNQQRAIAQQQSNARHHPPPRPTEMDDKVRVGGRVHAVVRWRGEAESDLPSPIRHQRDS